MNDILLSRRSFFCGLFAVVASGVGSKGVSTTTPVHSGACDLRSTAREQNDTNAALAVDAWQSFGG